MSKQVEDLLIELAFEEFSDLLSSELLGEIVKRMLEAVQRLGEIGFCTERTLIVLHFVLVGRIRQLSFDSFASCLQASRHSLLENVHQLLLEVLSTDI